jgi:hypothetical protein
MHLRFQRHCAPSVIWFITASCASAFIGSALGAQVRPNPADSAARAKARADSISRADSLALVKELEKLQGAKPDTTSGPVTGPQGSTNPRLLPDISAVGDFVADLSPKGSTQEDGTRVGVREVELAVQAAVDPYFRGDVFLGISDEEGIAIEQAFLTTTSLPQELELKIGRFLMPLGKQNTTHRHDLHTVEYPYVIQRFFGPEGQKGTGLWLSRVFAPLGFYQEVQLTAIDRIAEKDETLEAGDAVNRKLSGLGYSARLRNYWDLNESTNLEISGWGLTGRREEPTSVAVDNINAMNARQTTYAAASAGTLQVVHSAIGVDAAADQRRIRVHSGPRLWRRVPACRSAGSRSDARYQVHRRLRLRALSDHPARFSRSTLRSRQRPRVCGADNPGGFRLPGVLSQRVLKTHRDV